MTKVEKWFQSTKEIVTNSFRSLHFVLTAMISLSTLALMLIASLTMYTKFTDVLKNNISKNSQQTITQAANALNFYVDDLITVSDAIVSDFYNNASGNFTEIQQTLENTRAIKKDIASVGIYDTEGNILALTPNRKKDIKPTVDIANQRWFQTAVTSPKVYTFHPPRVQDLFQRQYPWIVTLSREISYMQDGMNHRLVLSIDMNFNIIEKHCSNISIGKRGYMYIVDDQNNIIFHPQQQMIYAGIKSEDLDFLEGKEDGQYVLPSGDKVLGIKSLNNTDWRLVGVSYLEEQYTTRNEIVTFLIALLLVDMLVIILVSVTISRSVSNPITGLVRAMEEVRQGNFSIRCPEGGLYEVDSLSQSFNTMVDQVNSLMEQIKTEEQQLRKSELKALQAQINPHFLYNTLDSILWMCEQNDGKRASQMVEALATLFRISISRGKELITIREELMHAESYLIIQKMRYKDQFEYEFQIDESLTSCQTLKIILQPMIENAIYHGIDRMVDKGLIEIIVRGDGNDILMEVRDNGLGMPEEVVKGILNQKSENVYGIGVKNVNDRIEIYFGKGYGLHIESELDEGTTVTIRIPKLEENDMPPH